MHESRQWNWIIHSRIKQSNKLFLFHSLIVTRMYIPDSSPQNITLFFTAIIGVSIVVLRELKPTTRLGYSKFASTNSTIWKVEYNIICYELLLIHLHMNQIPSRWGMLLIYMPSALLFLALLTLPSAKGHVWITVLLSAFHYMKRIYVGQCSKRCHHLYMATKCFIQRRFFFYTSTRVAPW